MEDEVRVSKLATRKHKHKVKISDYDFDDFD